MEIFRIIEPGASTTIQDTGRFGFQSFGVPLSGALDDFSARVANILVGNNENKALLEITYTGPKMVALGTAYIALTGASMNVLVNGKERAGWTSFFVQPGDEIRIKPAVKGVRSYLAVSGGLDVPVIMDSRSTCLSGGFGGMQGRRLIAGDILEAGKADIAPARTLPVVFIPDYKNEISLRALPGPQYDFFDEDQLELFFSSEFAVGPMSDRMGYRLEGKTIDIKEEMPKSIISEPGLPGVVQITPDGNPIIILREQTMGGYSKIASIISTDLNLLAQVRPGGKVKFNHCGIDEAHEIRLQYVEKLCRIRQLFH